MNGPNLGDRSHIVDLRAFLLDEVTDSKAFGVNSAGHVVGIAWGDLLENLSTAVLWTPQ